MGAKFTNGLTPAEAERLALLSEECAEVIQIIGKILRHGYESSHPERPTITNRKLLSIEIGHVEVAIQLMTENPNGGTNDIELDDINNSSYEKSLTINKYLHHNKV